jgi:hypothetical protein
VTVTEAPASATGTESTEDEETEDFFKKKSFLSKREDIRMMGEQMDHRWEQDEQKTSLRHHLAMLKYSRDRIKNLYRGLILTEWW